MTDLPSSPALRHTAHLAPLRSLLAVMLVWGLIALMLALAMYSDELRKGRDVQFGRAVVVSCGWFLPLVLLNWAGLALFDRHPRLLRPQAIFLIYLPVALLIFPLFLVYETAMNLFTAGRSFDNLLSVLAEQSRYAWWMDFTIVSAAYGIQVAYSIWRQHRQQEQALRDSAHHNLQLRLTLLQGQLEPHFLFNALNSISSLVRSDERQRANAALVQLSELLRYALRASRNGELSLDDELAFTRDYLALQQLRFGARLQLDWQRDPQLDGSRNFPPLLLQPLVENAIRHGLETHDGGMRLSIAVHADQDQLRICISNSLSEPGAPANGHGVGLALTRERLHLLFGPRARLVARGEAAAYTVELSLPAESTKHGAHTDHR